jgi:hypothetical protein
MRTSILGTFFLASEQELLEGERWYELAHLLCWQLSRTHGVTISTAAKVIAALSPQNPWERNCLDAENVIRAFVQGGESAALDVRTGSFNANKLKAIKALTDPNYVLTGQKVSAFYGSILGEPGAVCVDGHAYSIWLGERVSTSRTPKITPKLYKQIQTDFVDCTTAINTIQQTNYTPSQIQAITWVVHRNLYK